MTELDKLRAGLEFDFTDPVIDALKLNALKLCQKLNATDITDTSAREVIIRELFGSVGKKPSCASASTATSAKIFVRATTSTSTTT